MKGELGLQLLLALSIKVVGWLDGCLLGVQTDTLFTDTKVDTKIPIRKEVVYVKRELRPAPRGFKWVFTRFRRVKNSIRILDAHDYGYEAWCFLVPAK